MADYPIPPWLQGQDIVGAYQRGVALGQSAAAQNQQAQAESIKFAMDAQQARDRALERAHETMIKNQEDQIALGLRKQELEQRDTNAKSAMAQRDANVKAALAQRAEESKVRSASSAEKFIRDQGKSQWYSAAAAGGMTPAEYAKLSGTAPPDMNSEDAKLMYPTAGSMTPNKTYLDRSRHAQALLDVRSVDKALDDVVMVNRPDTDPRRSELLKRRESAKAALSAIESQMLGEGADTPAPPPTPAQARTAADKIMPAKPEPLPARRSAWVKGVTYVNKEGKVATWDGTRFVAPD